MNVNDTIRKHCLEIREQILPDKQQHVSHAINQKILTLTHYKQAQHIAFYHAVHGEIILKSLYHTAEAQQKKCYFPVMHKNTTLSFLPANSHTIFNNNPHGIPEPSVSHEQAIALEKIDLMLMPLVAFNKQGARLGMGKGYYDRTLEKKRPSFLLGVAYEFQCQPKIQTQVWDVPMHAIVTEKTIYWRK